MMRHESGSAAPREGRKRAQERPSPEGIDVAEQKRVETLRLAAYQVSEAAQAAGSLEEFFGRTQRILGTLIPAGNFYVALLDPDRESLSFPYFVDEVDPPPARKRLGRGLTEYVIRTGEPLLATPEVFDDLVARGEVEPLGASCVDWLGSPLKVSGATIGAVVVQTYGSAVRLGGLGQGFSLLHLGPAGPGHRPETVRRGSAQQPFPAATGRERRLVRQLGAGPGRRQDSRFGGRERDLRHAGGGVVAGPGAGAAPSRIPADAEGGPRRPGRARQPYNVEFRIRRKGDGELRHIHSIAEYDRKRSQIFGVINDVTQRKQDEEERRRMALMVATAPNSITVHDLEGNFLYANQRALELHGYGRDEFMALNQRQLVVPADEELFAARARELLASGEAFLEVRHLRRDGTVLPLDVSLKATTWGGGQAILGVATDITERRRAEEALLALQAELEQRVQERTSALVEANRELESFSYSVSHDLRAPVRAIDGFARLLEKHTAGSLDEEGRRLLATVRKNSLRMGNLIDALLALSRAGRSELRREEIGMARAVSEVLGEVLPGELREKVDVRLGDLPAALGDRALVRQVLLNLLLNAVKFSARAASPVVEVDSRRTDGAVEYFVRDNGVGFDQKYVDKLFGVFQRLHSEKEFPGTGIGLSLVRRIVERHGGRVRAEGVVNGGATFSFTLGPA